MRFLWRLAYSALAARRSRTLLLAATLALATALLVTVSAATATLADGLRARADRLLGSVDARIVSRAGPLEASLLSTARAWPEVRAAAGERSASLTVTNAANGDRSRARALGMDLSAGGARRIGGLVAGRRPRRPEEVVVGSRLRRELGAAVGARLRLAGSAGEADARVVGVERRAMTGARAGSRLHVPLATLARVAGGAGTFGRIALELEPGTSVSALKARRAAALPSGTAITTRGTAAGGLDRAQGVMRLLRRSLWVTAVLGAGLIVLGGLTDGVVQRQRELGIVRALGAGRLRVAAGELLGAGALAAMGALAGVPLGLGVAAALHRRFGDALDVPLRVPADGIGAAILASSAAALAGGLVPAVRAASVPPGRAMAAPARRPRPAHAAAAGALGLLLAASGPALVVLPAEAERAHALYAQLGGPLAVAGYALLAGPLMLGIGGALRPLLERRLGVPGLGAVVRGAPFRHGLMAAALAIGPALALSLWMGGRGLAAGFLAGKRMPDLFLHSYFGLSGTQWREIRSARDVRHPCRVTMFPVQASAGRTAAGGSVPAPTPLYYVSVDPGALVATTELTWIEGDAESAARALSEQRSLIVNRAFRAAHGVGAGGTVELMTRAGPKRYEIAAVAASPALDVAVRTFGLARAYGRVARRAVVGPRRFAQRDFARDATHLVLMNVAPEASEARALDALRAAAPDALVGSTRAARDAVRAAARELTRLLTPLAAAALVVCAAAVANLLLADIRSRRYDLGIMRATGASRAAVARLVLGQALLLAAAGCGLGAALGYQLALCGRLLHGRLFGLQYPLAPVWDVFLWSAAATLGAAALAALPALRMVIRPRPIRLIRET